MTEKDAARYARYAEAVSTIVGYPSETMMRAVMAVADAELAEREMPDPLVGRLVACADPSTGRVLAVGKVTEVNRADGSMRLTAMRHDDPDAPHVDADPAALPPGMNWRDHLDAAGGRHDRT
ncbi:hypothetical protein [Streptomyces sp. SID8352]|uniref:hypothetical protein n=1 Tax=Streptomyces sp. SID8352 TaxID=2690338 RepID=UPI0013717A91|nr:hypothetical protein [Streptomyces sp. SID8352]MYU24644.1 hypothetical protein [Streptomyces sp. SID8352]